MADKQEYRQVTVHVEYVDVNEPEQRTVSLPAPERKQEYTTFTPKVVHVEDGDDRDEPKEGVTYYTTLAEIFYELSGGAVGTAPRPLAERVYRPALDETQREEGGK